MALALLEDVATEEDQNGEKIVSDMINIDQFKRVFARHRGVLENLNISLVSSLLPAKRRSKKTKEVEKNISSWQRISCW